MSGGGGGTERYARRLLRQVQALEVPTLPNPDVAPPSRIAFARAAGFELDAWQQEAVTSTSRKLLFLCSRQSGKSTTSGLLAGYEACFTPNALILMLAPSLRQSGELFRSCLRMLQAIDPDELAVPAIVNESALRLELENGSRIIALPGSEATTRGYAAATLVIVDEAARVPDALIAAVRPTLATTNGRLVALSTPYGKRGWFYLEWTSGTGWDRSQVQAKDCPRISAEFLADELRSLGPRVFVQEYECEFFEADTAAFSTSLIERAVTSDVTPLWGRAA
ncbi:MAG: terminase [Gemmatimonadetes bacterium]|nr:terminase [Gemmatimonadota bacterium]